MPHNFSLYSCFTSAHGIHSIPFFYRLLFVRRHVHVVLIFLFSPLTPFSVFLPIALAHSPVSVHSKTRKTKQGKQKGGSANSDSGPPEICWSTVQRVDGDFTCLSLPAAVLKPKMWKWFSTGGGHQRALVGVNGPTFSLYVRWCQCIINIIKRGNYLTIKTKSFHVGLQGQRSSNFAEEFVTG